MKTKPAVYKVFVSANCNALKHKMLLTFLSKQEPFLLDLRQQTMTTKSATKAAKRPPTRLRRADMERGSDT